MTRTTREVNLSTRAARDRLEPSGKPYYRTLDQGLHIGYRKGAKGSAWVVRWLVADKAYKVESLDARPDDVIEADGETVLNWTQAQAAARKMFAARQRIAAGLEAEQPAPRGPYTVKDAVADYLEAYKAGRTKGRGKASAQTEASIDAFILPELGALDTAKLTATRLRKWHQALAETGARLRSKKEAEKPRMRDVSTDPEAIRRRRSTANRVLTILKAVLNHAWREGVLPNDEAWRRVRPFPEADSARVRYLTTEEAGRLLNACQGSFRDLVAGALLTGCRYGELAALKVVDLNTDSGTIHIRTSKSGKGRHVVLNDEGKALFERLATGRAGDALLFVKTDGMAWGKSHQFRPFGEACDRAKIVPVINFHQLRHTWASLSIMAGAPLMVVAQNLGHRDTRMVERHYGHLAESFVAETIRRTAPSFGLVQTTNVVPLGQKG